VGRRTVRPISITVGFEVEDPLPASRWGAQSTTLGCLRTSTGVKEKQAMPISACAEAALAKMPPRKPPCQGAAHAARQRRPKSPRGARRRRARARGPRSQAAMGEEAPKLFPRAWGLNPVPKPLKQPRGATTPRSPLPRTCVSKNVADRKDRPISTHQHVRPREDWC